MCPAPIRPEVGDDRWVPLAGPTSQRAGEGSARGWAKAWAAVLQASSGAGGGPRPMRAVRARKGKRREGLVELGRGESEPAQKGEKAFFFSFFCKTEILNYFANQFSNYFQTKFQKQI